MNQKPHAEIATLNNALEIRGMPITFETPQGGSCHESLLRSYQILEQVKTMLRDEVPPKYILLLVGVMEQDVQEREVVK